MFKLSRKPVPTFVPTAMREVQAAQSYAGDMAKAVTRLTEAWNLTQMEDALRSIETFAVAARFAAGFAAEITGKKPDDRNV